MDPLAARLKEHHVRSPREPKDAPTSAAEVALDRIPKCWARIERLRAAGSVSKLPSSLADEGRL